MQLNKLFFILFLLPLFSAAQSNYQPGYIVTSKGDTIRGFIDYRGWDSNPTDISFKSSINGDKKTYSLNNIDLFSINGLATYKKYTCSISMDITNTAHLVDGRDTSFKTATVFLQKLQQGKNLALYSYTDDLKTRFYVGEAPDYLPTELIYRIYNDVSAEGAGRTINENTYQKQLFALAYKYNALDDKLNSMFANASYTRDDILAIVSRINNISKSEYEKKYPEKTKLNVYISAALNVSSTSSPAGSSYLAGGAGSPYTSYLPAAAFGIDVNPSAVSGKVEFRVEFSVASTQFRSSYQLKVNPFTAAKASYDQLGLSVSPQLIFNIYNAPNLKFYLGGGLVISHFSYSNTYFGSPNPATQPVNFPDEQYEFTNSGNLFILKAGFRDHKNWEVFFNYLSSTTISTSPYFGFANVADQIGISYFFGK